MKNIKVRDDEAVVYLRKGFYEKEPIERATDAFSGDFSVKIGETEGEHVVRLKTGEMVEPQKAAHHFLNYVLSEMNRPGGNI